MFKIQRMGQEYRVGHYVVGDPNPTPTEKTFSHSIEAWQDAFGRAARMAMFTNKPQDVEIWGDRAYRISVERLR